MYDYYQKVHEAHEHVSRREREAEAERMWREAGARPQRHWSARMVTAMQRANLPATAAAAPPAHAELLTQSRARCGTHKPVRRG